MESYTSLLRMWRLISHTASCAAIGTPASVSPTAAAAIASNAASVGETGMLAACSTCYASATAIGGRVSSICCRSSANSPRAVSANAVFGSRSTIV